VEAARKSSRFRAAAIEKNKIVISLAHFLRLPPVSLKLLSQPNDNLSRIPSQPLHRNEEMERNPVF
jgi:hypothetical protein